MEFCPPEAEYRSDASPGALNRPEPASSGRIAESRSDGGHPLSGVRSTIIPGWDALSAADGLEWFPGLDSDTHSTYPDGPERLC